jgi:hypothetical protein
MPKESIPPVIIKNIIPETGKNAPRAVATVVTRKRAFERRFPVAARTIFAIINL